MFSLWEPNQTEIEVSNLPLWCLFGEIWENKELLCKTILLVEACGLSSSLVQQLQFVKSNLSVVE